MVLETSRVSLFPRHAWVLIYYLWWHTRRGHQLMPESSALWLSTGAEDKHSRQAGTWTPWGCPQPLRWSRVCFYFTQPPSYFSGDQGRHLMLTHDVKGWTTAKSDPAGQWIHTGGKRMILRGYTLGLVETRARSTVPDPTNVWKTSEMLLTQCASRHSWTWETPWEARWYLEPKFLLVLCNSP